MPTGKRLFCCAGDVQFQDTVPSPGLVIDVQLKPFSETCNFLQYRRPLTPKHPCYFARIRSLSAASIVTVGIAGPGIHDDIHPGSWNGTVGYRNTGQCYSSHLQNANTEGEQFVEGDEFGVLVTHFGKNMSTIVFLKNKKPVATRYIFQADHSQFLPTIALENGPIELGVMWPEAVTSRPQIKHSNMSDWIKPTAVKFDSKSNVFYTDSTKDCPELIIQSPLPLSKDLSHYEVVVKEVSPSGAGPTIGIATCSPLNPPPTCALLNDYFRWHPDGKLLKTTVGQRLGWGVHYNPTKSPHACDKDEQLVLCYVTMDLKIVYAKIVMQPPGGWYPIAMLHPYAARLEIDMESNSRPPVDLSTLDDLFHKLLPEAETVVKEDIAARDLDFSQFRHSEDLNIQLDSAYMRVALPRERKGIHVIQFRRPLNHDHSYFCVDIKRMGDSSVVCVGIADSNFPLNKYPGRLKGTVGYQSRDGKMYYNDKDNGNTAGQRYGKGDQVGLEIEVFELEMSVALFSHNGCPVGTRYLTQLDHTQFLPTIAICGNGGDVEIDVLWQTRISSPPLFNVTNLEHWCLPEGARIDKDSSMVLVEPGHTEAEAIQAPYSLHRTYNHFEVELIEEFDEHTPPPAIALCTASPFDPTPKSNFKQDFIRFWATGPAAQAVKKGDLMGWGMLYPDSSTHHDAEQLVICYLTINRDVALTRVMYQPPGGFYPVVLLPPGVDRVKMNFGATLITEHPFTEDTISQLVHDAQRMISEEERKLAAGTDPEVWDSEENKAKYLKPIPTSQGTNAVDKLRRRFMHGDLPGIKRARRTHNMANLVEQMVKANMEQNNGGLSGQNGSCENLKKIGRQGSVKSSGQSEKMNNGKEDSKTSKTCVVL